MAKKPEERDWSEIIAEVRSKAQTELEEAVDEIRPKVKEIVEKVRKANFHEEAEEFLAKLRKLADEFSQSEDERKSTTTTTTSTRTETYKYLDDDGVKHKRPPRAEGKQWTEAQKKKYMANYKEKYG